jgi:hypothetical protein
MMIAEDYTPPQLEFANFNQIEPFSNSLIPPIQSGGGA